MKPVFVYVNQENDTIVMNKKELECLVSQYYEQGYNDGLKDGTHNICPVTYEIVPNYPINTEITCKSECNESSIPEPPNDIDITYFSETFTGKGVKY